MANRIAYANAVMAAATLITASSEQSVSPFSHLKNQLRQKTGRSKVGWTITEDNRRIDVTRPAFGTYVVLIATGLYTTGAALATAIVAALEAADSAPVWACSYSTSTFKFTISSNLNFDLKWQSGANAYRSVGLCLGFVTTADQTAAASYTGANVSYQSRVFLRFQGTAGAITSTLFAILQHNLLSGSGNVRVQASAIDDWSTPTVVATLTGITTDPAYLYTSARTFAWFRVTIENVQDPSAYTEVGIIYLGTYVEPQYCIADDLSAQSESFATLRDAIAGTRFVNVQPERLRWAIGWKDLPPAARNVIEAFLSDTDVGECFFFDFDPATSGELVYVSREAFSWQFVPFEYRAYSLPLVEAL